MNLAYPRVLFFLLVLIPVVVIQFLNYRRGRADLKTLSGAESEELLTVYDVKSFFLALLFDLFVFAGIVAMAGVSWGTETVEEDRAGLELSVVVDVSRSMLAEDIPPSRISRTASVIRGLVRELPGTRFSMVVFKGDATTVVPMTEDSAILDSVLDYLGPAFISAPGTNIARGLEEALDSFPEGSARNRAIVLFTDGGSLSGSPYEALNTAVYRGIPVFSVGAGTPGGTTVFLSDGTPILDNNGNPVVSRLEPEVLMDLAEESGGEYYSLAEPSVFTGLLSGLRQYEEVRTVRGFRLEPVRRFRLFAVLAAIFLFAHMLLRTTRVRGLL